MGRGEESGSTNFFGDGTGVLTDSGLSPSSGAFSRTARKKPPPPIASFQTRRHFPNWEAMRSSLGVLGSHLEAPTLTTHLVIQTWPVGQPILRWNTWQQFSSGNCADLAFGDALATTDSFSTGSNEQVEYTILPRAW